MKFGSTIVAVAAVAAQAAAIGGEKEGHSFFKQGIGHCGTPGEKCYTAKNAARAVADAIKYQPTSNKNNHGFGAFCSINGTSGCNERWAHVEKIGAAAEKLHDIIARREAEADAEAVANPRFHWINYCGVAGQACDGKREALSRRDAQPAANPRFHWINYCGLAGQACDGKRDVTSAGHGFHWADYCDVPGSRCQQKRAAEANPEARFHWINYCGLAGQACDGKRDVPAELQIRTAGPEARFHWINYCGVAGQACDGKRDAVKEVQSAIRKFNPAIEKAECHQEGQPCNLIVKAQQAFKGVQRREAEARFHWINYCGVAGQACDGKRDAAKLRQGDLSLPAKAHLYGRLAGAPEALKAEEDADSENGANTLAARAIDELEATIQEGMDAVYEL